MFIILLLLSYIHTITLKQFGQNEWLQKYFGKPAYVTFYSDQICLISVHNIVGCINKDSGQVVYSQGVQDGWKPIFDKDNQVRNINSNGFIINLYSFRKEEQQIQNTKTKHKHNIQEPHNSTIPPPIINLNLDFEIEIECFWSGKQSEYLIFSKEKQMVYAKDGQMKWRRQQGVIESKFVQMVDYKHIYQEATQYYQMVFNQASIPHLLITRINAEINNLADGLHSFVNLLTSFYYLPSYSYSSFTQHLSRHFSNSSSQYLYGLRKMIVLGGGKFLYGIDSKTGQIKFKKQKQIEAVWKDLIVEYQEDSNLYTISRINLLTAQFQILFQHSSTRCHLQTFKQLIFFQCQNKSFTYPQQKQILGYQQNDGFIEGLRFFQGDKQVIWRWKMVGDLVAIQSNKGEKGKVGFYYEQNIYYKFMDFNSIAVLTRFQNTLILNILSKYGNTIYTSSTPYFYQQTPLITYSQNLLLIAYYQPSNNLYQLWLLQMFEKDQQQKVFDVLQKYWWSKQPKLTKEVQVFEQKFGFAKSIKSIEWIESKHSLLKNDLLIISKECQIYKVDRNLINIRRPKPFPIYQNTQLPAHKYLLPFQPIHLISFNNRLNKLSKLQLQYSQFQSTIFILGYGGDLFLRRIAIGGGFDIVGEQFSYLGVVIAMVVVSVGLLIIKKMTEKAKMLQYINK